MVHDARLMREEGTGIGGLIAAWGANQGTVGLSWDLAIAALAFAVWALAETRLRRDWPALAVIPAAFAVGLSFARPLCLFLRTRPVA